MANVMKHRLLPGLVLLLACVAVFGLGRMLAREAPQLGPAVAYAADGPTARVEQVTVSGLDGGKVLIGDQEILTLVVRAAGFSGYERAAIVTDRLNRAIAAGLRPEDVTVRTEYGNPVIQSGAGEYLVTVTPDDARLAGENPDALAGKWADNLRVALGGSASGGGDSGSGGEWRPSEPYSDKFVPILSLLEGVRVGVARVNGPRSRVALTQGVAQFSINFASFLEIDIYVPISTRVPGRSIDRVQGVGVTGLGDLKL